MMIKTVAQLKAALRDGPYTGLGGYPLYFITSDGGVLSFDSARKQFREIVAAIWSNDRTGGWRVMACDVNWEDGTLVCDHSGERIPSAYGDDPSDSSVGG